MTCPRQAGRLSAAFACLATIVVWLRAVPAVAEIHDSGELVTWSPPSSVAWIGWGLQQRAHWRLNEDAFGLLLGGFRQPERKHTIEWERFRSGSGSAKPWSVLQQLAWDTAGCGGLDEDQAPAARNWPGPELDDWVAPAPLLLPASLSVPLVDALLGVLPPRPRIVDLSLAEPRCPNWKNPRRVLVARPNGEYARLRLMNCEGTIASGTLDEVSVLARAGETTPRPTLPLPLEPAGQSGEWVDHVKLLHPRLVWILQQVAHDFPGRMITIVSGYRRDRSSSRHTHGRALDLSVYGTQARELLDVCLELPNTACGYYPNHGFVHFDLRPPHLPKVVWVDVSQPGEPSRYAETWPGLPALSASGEW